MPDSLTGKEGGAEEKREESQIEREIAMKTEFKKIEAEVPESSGKVERESHSSHLIKQEKSQT